MYEVKYKSLDKFRPFNKIAELTFKYPVVYFSLLIAVSLLILILSPHAVVFKDPKTYELKLDDVGSNCSDKDAKGYELELDDVKFSDFAVDLPSAKYFRRQNAPFSGPDSSQSQLRSPQCSGFSDSERFDCFPQENVSEDECNLRGCCWAPVNSPSKGELGVPYCYYPSSFRSYKFLNVSTTDSGVTAFLQHLKNSSYPDDVQLLRIDINYLNENVLQVKVYDAKSTRFESPFPKISITGRSSAKNTSYVVNIDKDKLGFNVLRKSNNQSIFNTEDVGGLIFSNQLLQLSARLPSHHLYGLGQQRNNFKLDMNWRRITLFNHDSEPADNINLYGSHPFYLALEDNGLSSGVLLLNTNAMDIILQPTPAITYRTIGGVLDFYLFLGPSPADVLRQYTELVGRPFMPPYWSLGFHLCRFGYTSLNETIKVWNRTRAAGIPLDTQWNDIDYMERRNDFTYDKVAFKGLPDFVDELHKEGMHYMIILDPGVSAGETPGTYPPYDDGLKEGIFIKDPTQDKPFITKVWNDKNTVLPDFFNPKTQSYWQSQISKLHNTFAFDGLWIDMNDPSTEWSGGQYGCTPSQLDNPPYQPVVVGGKLYDRTICMSARHYGALHYDVHNIYASQEAVLTTQALQNIRKLRPFVISRSSYPGHGHIAGVWTGDVQSSWDDMVHSISDVLSFSLFGIPMSGADICGFNGNTTVDLCLRWTQLGAFYPFSRNHNSIENIDQDPVALGPAVVEAARKSLLVRYSLLPYLYTLFWHAHSQGDTVARPMFVEFPEDDKTYDLHSQFLWGPGLLIAPILSQEKSYPTAYLPAGRWYDFYSSRPIESKGSTYLLTPSDSIPLLLRGGHILPSQLPNTTTTVSRKNPFSLLVSLCCCGKSRGDLYWDDGDSLDHENGIYNYVTFFAANGNLTSTIQQWKYNAATLLMAKVKVLGVDKNVSKVLINGNSAKFTYNNSVKLLDVTDLSVDLSKPFTLLWS